MLAADAQTAVQPLEDHPVRIVFGRFPGVRRRVRVVVFDALGDAHDVLAQGDVVANRDFLVCFQGNVVEFAADEHSVDVARHAGIIA